VSHDDPRERRAFGTRVIHAGQEPDPSTGAVMPPIYATSTYAQASPGVHKGFDYGRSHNPTRFALERCLADLESGSRAFAFASGLAAIATVLELLDAGAHVVAGDDLYGGTYRLLERVRTKSAALSVSYVDLSDPQALESAIRPETRMVLVESPTNPLAAAGRSRGDQRNRAQARADLGGRQHLRDAVGAAAARARLRHRRALDDEYLNGHSDVIGGVRSSPRRAQRAARRAPRLPAERRRRDRRAL